MVARTAGRKGRPYQRARAQVLADSGGICWLCGHPGAGDIDHDPPLKYLRAMELDPNDPAVMRAAHGSTSRCGTCLKCCNQSKKDKPAQPRSNNSRVW